MCRGYTDRNERPQERSNPDVSRECDAIIWTENAPNIAKDRYSAHPEAPLLEKNSLAPHQTHTWTFCRKSMYESERVSF